ncbi:MAG: PQQ-dependent sugar dehydrogenase [Pirellulales bacterium]
MLEPFRWLRLKPFGISGAALFDWRSHTSVVSEWSLNASGNVIASSRRDILTQSQPRGDHNIGKVAFNPNLSPGDPDYGNMYISFGDGGNYRSPSAGGSDTTLSPNGQDTTNFLGAMLRIDSLQGGSDPYTVPADNPFGGQAGILDEIWAYGLRNLHQFSWDRGGNGDMLIADIGQRNIEEVNIGVQGANYGWSVREGTFDMTGKAPDNPIAADVLPANHPSDSYTYPVTQYDHDADNTGQNNAAIAGGFVYRGTQVAELRGKYIFGNFGTFGRFGKPDDFQDIYAVDVDQLQLRDDFSDLASLSDVFLAPLQKLSLVDSSGDPIQLLDLVRQKSGNNSQTRADMRFGIDAEGEIYVTSKKDGTIRCFIGTPLPDYDFDGDIDGADFLDWQHTDGSPDGLSDWQNQYGSGSPGGQDGTVVPEPKSVALLLAALAIHARTLGRSERVSPGKPK